MSSSKTTQGAAEDSVANQTKDTADAKNIKALSAPAVSVNEYDALEDELLDDDTSSMRWMPIVIIMLVVFGFFSLAWYAYNSNTSQQDDADAPVIAAYDSPMRTLPEEPGGMQVPNQDKEIYNAVATPQPASAGATSITSLQPSSEQPVVRDQQNASTEEGQPIVKNWVNKQPSAEKTENLLAAASAPAKPVAEIASDDGKITVKDPVAARVVSDNKKAPVAAASVKAQEAVPVKPEPASKSEEQPKQVSAPKATQPAPVSAQPVVSKPAAPPVAPAIVTSGYKVQLAALRSKSDAEQFWNTAKRKNAFLARESYVIKQVTLPEKGVYYRVQVPASSKDAANRLCAQLKAAAQGCMVMK